MQGFLEVRDRLRQTLTVVGLGFSALVLVSCGGDEEPNATETPATSVEETVTTQPPDGTGATTITAVSDAATPIASTGTPSGSGATVVLGQETEGFIEALNGVLIIRPQEEPVVVDASQPLEVQGWAVDRPAQSTADTVLVMIDDHEFSTEYGQPRPDVAEYLESDAYLESGFRVEIPAGTLSPGRYTIELRVNANDGSGYYPATSQMQVDILVVDGATPGALASPATASASRTASPEAAFTPAG